MAKVTTRAGDSGYTGLLGSERVPKYDDRIEALGLIDEANSAIGLARATATDERARALLLQQQQVLYRLMAELATTADAAGKIKISPIAPNDVAELERLSDDLKRDVQIGNRFVVPGENLPGATLDLARAVVRRAERFVARLHHAGEVANPEVIRYLNRLSDFLFVLARWAERGQTREAS
jgi:cob(I)alamin adenosyltransferase